MGPVPCTEAKRFFAAVVGVQLAIWAVRRSAARCGLCHERNEHPLLSYVVAIAFLLIFRTPYTAGSVALQDVQAPRLAWAGALRAPATLHDLAHSARRQSPLERLSLPFGDFLWCLPELGHRL
jgi:hypothetical protein